MPVGLVTAVQAASRASARTRATLNSKEENGTAKGLTTRSRSHSNATSSSVTSVAGARRRTALGDRTNASRIAASAAAEGSKAGLLTKDDVGKAKVAVKETTRTLTHTRAASSSSTTSVAARRLATTSRSTVASTSSAATSSKTAGSVAGKIRSHSRANKDDPLTEIQDAQVRESKRLKLEAKPSSVKTEAAAKEKVEERPKDYGWENLDEEDANDPLMVAEYHDEIFEYLKELEIKTLPTPDYMEMQRDINWNLRGILADWMIDIHSKFRLLPETLYLSFNLLDRFLSKRTIYMSKLQLVGITAMFIASKFEECLCPAIGNFIYVTDSGYTEEEILRAERYMLRVLEYDLSYPNPIHFLRRISKADGYDTQTRTVAKYFMEISGVDHRLLYAAPSLIAAAAFWAARLVLERGEWTATFVHYSSYSVPELLATAEIMLDYVCRPIEHTQFNKKYASKRFMRASSYVRDYMSKNFQHAMVPIEDGEAQDWEVLRIDLFAREDIPRPGSSSESESGSP
ncbi:G2/mitotic-specific cyclin [Tilletia horrida]|uniref:G2/mitotic-specific cyclin n=1 Tax=Tilletia horrida TaxID=155126 RepID=A0AAN6GGY8_9BASI|nr:G2/mitotic-specific cyclin [Tilletia horrida]KAK0536707.1 G2/mitotic-specific cyclin [Tilletia horrida]